MEVGGGGDDVVDEVDAGVGTAETAQVTAGLAANRIADGYEGDGVEQLRHLAPLATSHPAFDLDPSEHAHHPLGGGQRHEEVGGTLVSAQMRDEDGRVEDGPQIPASLSL